MKKNVPSLEEIEEECRGKHTILFLPALHITPHGKYFATACIPEKYSEIKRGIPSVYDMEKKKVLEKTILLDKPEEISIQGNTIMVRGKRLPENASTSFSLTMNLYARPGRVAAIPLSLTKQTMTSYLVSSNDFAKFQYHERKLPYGYIRDYSKLTSPNMFALALDAVNAAILGIGKKEPVRKEYFTVSCCGAKYGYMIRLELLPSEERKIAGRVRLRATPVANWFGVRVESSKSTGFGNFQSKRSLRRKEVSLSY